MANMQTPHNAPVSSFNSHRDYKTTVLKQQQRRAESPRSRPYKISTGSTFKHGDHKPYIPHSQGSASGLDNALGTDGGKALESWYLNGSAQEPANSLTAPQASFTASQLAPQILLARSGSAKQEYEPTTDLQVSHESVGPLAVTPIPQHRYRSPNNTSFTSKGDILFSSTSTYGILLAEALESKVPQNWKDEPMKFFGSATKVTLRIHLPGYGRTDYPINVCNDKAERDNVTKDKLARNVARGVRKALEENKRKTQSTSGHEQWALNLDMPILLGSIVLSRLCHVSEGSWQPELYFAQQSEALR